MLPIRVLIVDDHQVVRRGLRSMLSGAEDIEIAGEACDGREAMAQASALRPDVVLLDIRMPGVDGLRLIRCLTPEVPDLKIIILTIYDDEQFLLEAFRAGAHGYLLKDVGREKLLKAIRTVHQGGRILADELVDGVLRQFGELAQNQVVHQLDLSNKELELLRMVATGATNRQIAEEMYWSEATVKRKLSDVFQKLGASDRAQAIAVAMRHGLL